MEKLQEVLGSKKALFRDVNLVFASLSDGDEPKSEVDSSHKRLFFVLDQELCHLSSIAIDLGILYFFKDFVSVTLILESFLNAYESIDVQDAYDTMIYCGVNLIIWPCRTEWSKSPRLMECIHYGCDMLENARGGNA
ncbi:hypothetical protein ONS96_011926 [Cadophora gregata f. sp. sojae]|nr:hypothetical protein ONS96_011926 [Cadophora gregata f. sp. sojae]